MPTIYRGILKSFLWRGAILENFADRLNHFWTFGILLLLAFLISWKHGYTRAISCWTPPEFTIGMQQYVNDECWYQQTPYPFIDYDDPIPINSHRIEKGSKLLFQWLPIILIFQALVFKLPNLLMYTLHGYSGISFEKVANLTTGFENMNMYEREILAKQISRYMYNWCKQFSALPWRLLTALWLGVKILYTVNIIVQINAVNSFMLSGTPLTTGITKVASFGEIIKYNLYSNKTDTWIESPAFPRYTFCDFKIRKFNNVQHYTLQCKLTANIFNEGVYMFIWVWFLIVAIVTCLNIIIWTLSTLIPIFRKRYIKKAMELSDDPSISTLCMTQNNMDQFCNMIGEDGIMVLKLIAANSSDILVGKIVSNMWILWSYGGNQHQARQVSYGVNQEGQVSYGGNPEGQVIYGGHQGGQVINVPDTQTAAQANTPQTCQPLYTGKTD